MTLLVACALPALAAESRDGQLTSSKAKQAALEWSDFTANERVRAEVWGLSATEWDRYRSLMEGIRGSISPGTISPIEVLGIHAQDDAERRRYAEQWAVMMREDAERILAFQHAYDQAGRLLYPSESLIDVARLRDRAESEQALVATDRVLLFALPDCAACDAILSRLLARLGRVPNSHDNDERRFNEVRQHPELDGQFVLVSVGHVAERSGHISRLLADLDQVDH